MKHVSASQIETFKLCPKKWWYAKVKGLPTKTGEGAELGGRLHTQVENYLKFGKIEDWAVPIIAPGFATLNAVPKWSLVEEEITGLKTPGGVEIKGRIDLITPGDGVYDHKFRGDVTKYGTKADKLRQDAQAIIYLEYYRRRYAENQKSFKFAHLQYQTKGEPLFKAVKVEFTAQELQDSFKELCRFVDEEMCSYERKMEFETIGERKACWAYGGCDFMDICPQSPKYKGVSMALLTIGKKTQSETSDASDKPVETEQSILPPGHPPREVQPGDVVEAPKPKGRKKAAEKKEAQTQENLFEQNIPSQPVPSQPVPSQPVPSQPVPSQPVPSQPVEADAGFVQLDHQYFFYTPKEVGARRLNRVLYVDCYTTAGAQDLGPMVHATARKLAEEVGAADIRLAPGKGFDYGAWKATLACEVVKQVKTMGGALYIARGDLNDAVLDAIASVCDEVVRPMR